MSDWVWGPEFTPEEMACRDGSSKVVNSFMNRLYALRTEYGRPMVITSAYRSPEYNATVSSTGHTGPHTTGRAVDVQVSGKNAYDLVRLALKHGFTGIGLKQKGPHNERFVHLDDLTEGPRPWIWTY